ncbi:MAG TPA: hypothetical protein VLJ42_11295 [Solirubrobacteraceae bacterium]|nr:hypothetical protein [Solirubrobacteraceae bacterium]
MSQSDPPALTASRYGRYVGLVGLIVVVLITINTLLTPSNGATGIPPGERLAPFAVPLATSTLNGDADVATRPGDESSGRRPACTLRSAQILNICELYERGPVVLALFVDSGDCPAVLDDLQKLAPSFPGVGIAGVALKGNRAKLRELVSAHELTLPIGFDRDGALAARYKISSCPQLTFAYPGGVVQSKALLTRPPLATLRARIAALVAASRTRGWKPPTT